MIGLTFQGLMHRKDCSRFEKQHCTITCNDVVTKQQTQRQKLKTSFKIFREEKKSRHVEENIGIVFK